jgi:hypothetical protein
MTGILDDFFVRVEAFAQKPVKYFFVVLACPRRDGGEQANSVWTELASRAQAREPISTVHGVGGRAVI